MALNVLRQQEVLDYVFSMLYSLYTTFGVALNGFLLWLIIFYKHDSLREYRILLGNTTCTLLVLSFLAFFLQLRHAYADLFAANAYSFKVSRCCSVNYAFSRIFVIAGDALGYVPLGPARVLNLPNLSYFATTLLLVTDIYSFMTIAMCMVYKHRVLVGTSPSAIRIVAFISVLFPIPLSTGIALLINDPDFDELYAQLEKLRPESQLERYGRYCGLPNVKNLYVMYLIIVICLISIAAYTTMIVVRVKIERFVRTNHASMSPHNAKMFNMMVKALVIQSCMPILFSFPTKVLYFLMQFGVIQSVTAEYMVFAISPVVAAVDPCVTMFYVLPYRNYIKKLLRFRKKEGAAAGQVKPKYASVTITSSLHV